MKCILLLQCVCALFSYDGLDYVPLICNGKAQVMETNTGARVTTLEQTVIDSIADLEKISGMEETLRCLVLIPSLDYRKLLKVLENYDQSQLYQKVGYILEIFKDELYLPDIFFEECERKISHSKIYLFEKQSDFVFHKQWKLYAPKDLRAIINKGIINYDAR